MYYLDRSDRHLMFKWSSSRKPRIDKGWSLFSRSLVDCMQQCLLSILKNIEILN